MAKQEKNQPKIMRTTALVSVLLVMGVLLFVGGRQSAQAPPVAPQVESETYENGPITITVERDKPTDYPKDASIEYLTRLYGMRPGCLGSQYVSSYFTNAEAFKNPPGGPKNCDKPIK